MRDAEGTDDAPKRIKSVPGLILFFILLLASFGGTLGEASPAFAAGSILGATALLCTILYFAWLRGASAWKAVACFAGILVVVTLGTMFKLGQATLDARQDATTLAEMRFDADGNPILPADAAARGPMSKILAKIADDTTALNKDYMARLEAAGVYALFDAERLRANPAILKNCDAIAAIGPDVADFKRRHLQIMDNAPREIARTDMPNDLKEAAMAGMKESLVRARSDSENVWERHAGQIDEAFAVCRILARRTWEAQGSSFAFHSRRDMDEFNRHNDRVNQLAAEQQAIIDASHARLRQTQDTIKQKLN